VVDVHHVVYHSTMALNIKDAETERLVNEVARRTGESKTRAVRVAMQERLRRLDERSEVDERRRRLRRYLEHEVWPHVPADVRGRPVTKAEREAILGYGPEGH
jgi:antitoxin VapB